MDFFQHLYLFKNIPTVFMQYHSKYLQTYFNDYFNSNIHQLTMKYPQSTKIIHNLYNIFMLCKIAPPLLHIGEFFELDNGITIYIEKFLQDIPIFHNVGLKPIYYHKNMIGWMLQNPQITLIAIDKDIININYKLADYSYLCMLERSNDAKIMALSSSSRCDINYSLSRIIYRQSQQNKDTFCVPIHITYNIPVQFNYVIIVYENLNAINIKIRTWFNANYPINSHILYLYLYFLLYNTSITNYYNFNINKNLYGSHFSIEFMNKLNNKYCFNDKCNFKRKWRCKRCRFAGWCSRHCMKVDWKKFHHKLCKYGLFSKHSSKDSLRYHRKTKFQQLNHEISQTILKLEVQQNLLSKCEEEIKYLQMNKKTQQIIYHKKINDAYNLSVLCRDYNTELYNKYTILFNVVNKCKKCEDNNNHTLQNDNAWKIMQMI